MAGRIRNYREIYTNPIDQFAVRWLFVACLFGGGLMVWFFTAAYNWHVNHDPHSVATVVRTVIDPPTYRSSASLEAEVRFDRTDAKGAIQHCALFIPVGASNADVRIGDRYDVVPRGYCGWVYVVGRLSRP